MTVYVIRDGVLIEKDHLEARTYRVVRASLPAPNISRFKPMESPVTGKEITSWRDRDRDMAAVGCVDPRDLPQAPFEKRKADNARRQQLDSVADAVTDAADT